MQCVISWDGPVPILTITSENEGEELSLDLVAASDNLRIVLEIDGKDELAFKHMITEPTESSD